LDPDRGSGHGAADAPVKLRLWLNVFQLKTANLLILDIDPGIQPHHARQLAGVDAAKEAGAPDYWTKPVDVLAFHDG